MVKLRATLRPPARRAASRLFTGAHRGRFFLLREHKSPGDSLPLDEPLAPLEII